MGGAARTRAGSTPLRRPHRAMPRATPVSAPARPSASSPTATRASSWSGDIREDLHVCGQASTLLDPRALYPASLDLRPATVQRLEAEQQAAAQRIVATDVGSATAPPLAKLLVARGSSVPGSRGVELTDGDPATVWSERRPRIGQGEFVMMAAPQATCPSRACSSWSRPPQATAGGRCGRSTFYLVTDALTLRDHAARRRRGSSPARRSRSHFPIRSRRRASRWCSATPTRAGSLIRTSASRSSWPTASSTRPGATLEIRREEAHRRPRRRRSAGAGARRRAARSRPRRASTAVWTCEGARSPSTSRRATSSASKRRRCWPEACARRRGEAPRKAREKIERCKGGVGHPGRSVCARTRPRARASRRRWQSSRPRTRSTRSRTRWRRRPKRIPPPERCCAEPSRSRCTSAPPGASPRSSRTGSARPRPASRSCGRRGRA